MLMPTLQRDCWVYTRSTFRWAGLPSTRGGKIEGSRGRDWSPEEDGRGEQDHRQGEQGGHQGDEGDAARAPQQAAGYFILLTLKMWGVNTFMMQCTFGEDGVASKDLGGGSNRGNFVWTNDTCYLSTLKVNKYETHFWRIDFFWKKEENSWSTDHRCMRPDRFNPSMQYAPYPLTQHLLHHCKINCSWLATGFCTLCFTT